MTKYSKDKMKEICQDVLTNVLTTAANNLVIEAAICANSTDHEEYELESIFDKFDKIWWYTKQLFTNTKTYRVKSRDKEKELATYIKAINGELNRARSQAMIYLDTLVIDGQNNKDILNEENTWRAPTKFFLRILDDIIRCNSISEQDVKLALSHFKIKNLKSIPDNKRKEFVDYLKDNF